MYICLTVAKIKIELLEKLSQLGILEAKFKIILVQMGYQQEGPDWEQICLY